MDKFERAFQIVVGHEGGYSTDPHDRGNWTGGDVGKGELKGTKYGVSARAYPGLDIAGLTLDAARAIYLRDYWSPCRCGEMAWGPALVTFDSAINSGVRFASILLQRAVGAAPDGVIGPRTLASLAARDPHQVAAEMLAQRAYQMTAMPTWHTHGLGWIRRITRLGLQAAA
jgi:lysozyme family protein